MPNIGDHHKCFNCDSLTPHKSHCPKCDSTRISCQRYNENGTKYVGDKLQETEVISLVCAAIHELSFFYKHASNEVGFLRCVWLAIQYRERFVESFKSLTEYEQYLLTRLAIESTLGTYEKLINGMSLMSTRACALHTMGILYADGLYGITQDKHKAEQYFRRVHDEVQMHGERAASADFLLQGFADARLASLRVRPEIS